MRNLLLLISIASLFMLSCKNNDKSQVKNLATSVYHPASTNSKLNHDEQYKANKIDNFFSHLNDIGCFNGAVLFSTNNKVIFKQAYGFADFSKKTPLTINSQFQLASVSKHFTAVAIMMLKEKGLINYNDSIQKFFPDFPYHGITIRNLLQHRSGVNNYIYFIDPIWKQKSMPLNFQYFFALYRRLQPPAFNLPNQHFSYNNTNYVLLAAIVEKVTKLRFETFMKKYVFEPAGMHHTFINIYNGKTDSTLVKGYDSRHREGEINYLDAIPGDKGVYTTIEDLFIWDQALYTDVIVKQSTLKEAFEPGSPELKTKNYGFGWRIVENEKGHKITYHRGWWHGFRTYFMRNLTTHDAVIILSNVANEKGSLPVKEITDITNPHKDGEEDGEEE